MKAIHGWSDKSFSKLLALLGEMLPKDNEMPPSFYEDIMLIGNDIRKFIRAQMIVFYIAKNLRMQFLVPYVVCHDGKIKGIVMRLRMEFLQKDYGIFLQFLGLSAYSGIVSMLKKFNVACK